MWRRECKPRNGKTHKRCFLKFAAGLSNPVTPVDHSAQKTELLDVVSAMAAVTSGVNDGSLTVEEASHLTRILDGYANAVTTFDLVARVEALEAPKKRA
jgi:hypothetical protein